MTLTIKRDVGRLLNGAIVDVLGGPGGDPEACNYEAAARIYVALKLLKLPIEDEESTRCSLRNLPYRPGTKDEEPGNLYKCDFLEGVGWPPGMDEGIDGKQ